MNHFSAATCARVRDGVPELLIVPYLEPGEGKSVREKFAGGKDENGETLEETARREATEELGKKGFVIRRLEEVFQYSVFGHTKGFFEIEYEGDLREANQVEDSGVVLMPPRYESVYVLLNSQSFVYSHKKALREMILHFSVRYPEFAYLAMNFVSGLSKNSVPVHC